MPSAAKISSFPVASAVNSKVALSDSISAITSSKTTKSPDALAQLDIVTSLIDSPTVGTCIWMVFTAPPVNFSDFTSGGTASFISLDASITHNKPPISTVSPAPTLSFKTPSISALTSKVALSDSSSQITSSIST